MEILQEKRVSLYQGFTWFSWRIWEVQHVCPGYFHRNAMSGKWSIRTDESLVGTRDESESPMQSYWSVDQAENRAHVSSMDHLDLRPARFAEEILKWFVSL